MAKVQSREVSDLFREKVEPLIPAPMRDPQKSYRRKPGGGRKPIPARRIFEAIIYVLRTGCQWQALPKERFGSPGAVHTHFKRWLRAGFFAQLWQAGLAEYDDMEGIAWLWQSIDGTMVKARRWVVEAAHSWFNRFRKLLVSYEKSIESYEALPHLAAAIIAFRKCGVINV